MTRQTGGLASGATSTRSRSASEATSIALDVEMTPNCSPVSEMTRTGDTLICSLTLKFFSIAVILLQSFNKTERLLAALTAA